MEWINVKDKMPKDYDSVLIYDQRVEMAVGYWNKLFAKWYGTQTLILREVTHWRPLPEPPK
jgi:hypothetical protein